METVKPNVQCLRNAASVSGDKQLVAIIEEYIKGDKIMLKSRIIRMSRKKK